MIAFTVSEAPLTEIPDSPPPGRRVMTDEDRKRALELIRQWREDDSGYDEEMWPKLKAAMNETRRANGQPLVFPED